MDDSERDESITEARITGTSTRALAKLHGCTSGEIESVIDRRLDYELDNKLRLRAIKLDLARIETLMAPFFERAVKDKDVPSGTLCCKLLERRALLLGLDQSPTARVDVYQVEANQHPKSYERIRAAIYAVARGPNGRNGQLGPPAADGNGSDEPGT
jgi:hypothetical protein